MNLVLKVLLFSRISLFLPEPWFNDLSEWMSEWVFQLSIKYFVARNSKFNFNFKLFHRSIINWIHRELLRISRNSFTSEKIHQKEFRTKTCFFLRRNSRTTSCSVVEHCGDFGASKLNNLLRKNFLDFENELEKVFHSKKNQRTFRRNFREFSDLHSFIYLFIYLFIYYQV